MTAALLAGAALVLWSACGWAHGAVLIMNSAGASLSVVDLDTLRELRRIPVLREPHHYALTPDGRDVLVGDTGANELFDLDAATFALRRRIPVSDPYQLGFSPDGRFLVVNGIARNQVDVYDGATLKLRHRFALASMPSHLAFAPDSSMVFVSLQGSDRLAAIDLGALQVRWVAPVGKTPAGVLWLHNQVLVADMGSDSFAVVDPVDGHVERMVKTGDGCHQLFLSPDGRTLWVNNRVAGTTTAVDPETLVPERSFKIPGGPDDIAFAPDGRLWITQRFARTVAVMDPVTGAVQTAEVGRSPHGVFLNPEAR